MSGTGDERQQDPRQAAELSALADGTLDPARRREVEAQVAASPELRQRLEAERHAVAMLAAARERDRAPAALRERIDAVRRPARSRRRPMRMAPVGAVAAVALVLALVLPSGSPGGPSVSQAAALGARGVTMPAPLPQPGDHSRLQTAVGTLHFPNWAATLGWRATGQREDRLQGRRIVTMFYAVSRERVAYSIVSGPALPRPADTYIESFRQDGRTVVSWRQAGHTCVLSAAGLPERVLVALVGHA